ncbi:hypothetical protein [Baaleninema sp.]|uniref:hypothetical protein n=1 Tax=Baaleninema sp. TaxID=3101197 RepID=UPI003D002FBA
MSNADYWESETARQPWFASPSASGKKPTDSDADVPNLSDTLAQLRAIATDLVPVEAALLYLGALREPATLENRVRQSPDSASGDSSQSAAPGYLEELDEIERQFRSGDGETVELWQQLQAVNNEIRVKQRCVEALFWHLASGATGERSGLASAIDRMRDRTLQEEAEMQRSEIDRLSQQLPADALSRQAVNLFSDAGQAALGLMLEIEQRQRVIERLVLDDRSVPVAVTVLSIVYSVGVVGFIVLFVWLWGDGFLVESLGDRKLPLLGVPWPVLIWSLFGSLTAIVYRFLHRPFRRLGETAKWMWMRPIQGLLFGGASYLILEAGLSVLVDRLGSETPLPLADPTILVLSFLVGFSDRLAQTAFSFLEPQN